MGHDDASMDAGRAAASLPPAVRVEQASDHEAITRVVTAAFGSAAEAELVGAIRASQEYVRDLALVAILDGAVVGHVMISGASLDRGNDALPIAMLSPLAVAPEMQGLGIGAVLVRAVTERARELGEPLVVLEGSPVFYSRFGFEPSARYGIKLPLPAWASPEAGQVLILDTDAPPPHGTVVYPPAFDGVTEH